jgi:NADP-dependent 3-hydroxy acid dehydrogenase YdfG
MRLEYDELAALRGKVMLVTGGGSGLGRDVATQAAARGAKVAALDVRADRLAEVKGLVEAAKAECLTLRADVASEKDVVDVVRQTVSRWGRIDVVVNSAGIYRGGLITDLSTADYDLMFDINVKGTFLVTREVARVMLEQKSGHIINIASIGAKRVFPREIMYSASKWAVIGIGEGLAMELGPSGIRVTTICPTGMDTTFWEEIRKQRADWDPSRLLSSASAARAIIQIASLPPDVVVKEAKVYRPGQ